VVNKLAVVMFSLGGPDRLESVEPFLFNLFNDPAIIGAPGPIRWLLAKLISIRRAPVAGEIYRQMGGKSPLLEQTHQQANALESLLKSKGIDARLFVSMRYWHPLSSETVEDVKRFEPDAIVLLPLYPQFSTTTTGSSFEDWTDAASAAGLKAVTRAICCYPTEAGFVDAKAELIRPAIVEASKAGRPRLLFSAHGLPEKIVARGDPYQWQVEATVAAIVKKLSLDDERLDYVVCYQSRVGPLKWIGPATEDELARAARDGVPVVVVPTAFVSEHSETLVELDIEYRQKAVDLGVPAYIRVPTVGTSDTFIEGLAGLVADAVSRETTPCPRGGARICPRSHGRCICHSAQ
jgi:ferrochelatase